MFAINTLVDICSYRLYNFRINKDPVNTFKFKVCWKSRHVLTRVGSRKKGGGNSIRGHRGENPLLDIFYDGRFPYLDVCGQMGPIPGLSVSPYLYLPAIRGDIKIPGSDKWNQSREIWQFIMGLTTQSGIVPRLPCSGQILIVQAGGAFTLEELSLAAPVFLAIMTWLGWITPTENQTNQFYCLWCLFLLQIVNASRYLRWSFPLWRYINRI